MNECSTWRDRSNSFFSCRRIDFCRMYGSGVQSHERAGLAYSKSFSYLFQKKIFNQSLSEMPTLLLDGMFWHRYQSFFFSSTFFSSQICGQERAGTDLNGLVCC